MSFRDLIYQPDPVGPRQRLECFECTGRGWVSWPDGYLYAVCPRCKGWGREH